jgi:hypothetical protein
MLLYCDDTHSVHLLAVFCICVLCCDLKSYICFLYFVFVFGIYICILFLYQQANTNTNTPHTIDT